MNRRQALSKASRIVGDIRKLDQIVAEIVDQAVHVFGCTTSSRAILRDILSQKP